MTQALHLMNSTHIQKRITADGGRCEQLAKSDKSAATIITELYLILFGRKPDDSELSMLEAEFVSPGVDRRRLIEDIMLVHA